MSDITVTTHLRNILRLRDDQKKALERLGLETVYDLLTYFPRRYADASELERIEHLEAGQEVTLYGRISKLKLRKAFKSKIPMAEGVLEDGSGKIKLIWFNQAYIAKMFTDGEYVKLSGKVASNSSGIYIGNPEMARIKELPIDSTDSLFSTQTEAAVDETNFLTPIYAETKNVSSRFLYHTIGKLIANNVLDTLVDPIPQDILDRYHLPDLKKAILYIHFPKKKDQALAARKRFAFEEIFYVQIDRQRERLSLRGTPAYIIPVDEKRARQFSDTFDFPLTNAQKKAIEVIHQDFMKGEPMSRLLEGDVGSGKTAVAASVMHSVITTRPTVKTDDGNFKEQTFGTLQVAYMAPTEILAKQHFESFQKYFAGSGISIGLLTGSGCQKFPSKSNPSEATPISRAQLLKWVANGEIAIVVGTHALIRKTVAFKHLGLVVIDEQHRFGTKQRKELAKKANDAGKLPHLLSMTATPIPRTLALTIYGDLDLTILDEMPAGRKPVITEIIPHAKRDEMYEKVRKEIDAGRQAYVICPRIEEPDPSEQEKINAKSVLTEAKKLQSTVFKKNRVDVLHGKMTPVKKDAVMEDFNNGKIDILVATSVVEVGVNVPNATVIIIEGGDRFGLAQLHQLRGRVLRGTHQPYCYVCTESNNENTLQRLLALRNAKNGFELAEQDLVLRGAGELTGSKQSGLSDLGMDAIKNIKLVEAAREEAKRILKDDPDLGQFPHLQDALDAREKIHFE